MQKNPLFQIRIIFGTLLFLMAGGTVLFHSLEDFTWIQAFYFAVTTMTTVGYGDLIPTSDSTRLAVALYILVSVSLYVSLITHFGAHYLEFHNQRAMKKIEKIEKIEKIKK